MNSHNHKIIFIILALPLIGALTYSFYNSYSNENAKVFAFLGKETKCVVDPVIEKKFLGTERGKIPIGEAVDEAEDFAQKIIDEMNIINSNLTNEINAGNELVWLPEQCECKRCTSSMETDILRCQWEWTTGSGLNEKTHSCSCITQHNCKCVCSGDVCPFGEIEGKIDIIQEADSNIQKSLERIIDLIDAKNLLPGDPDRWNVLNKLLNSRVKMEECIIGYDSALDAPRAKMNLLSCRIALDRIYLHKLNIAGYFEDNISPFPHCYPFIADNTIKSICIENKDSKECREAIKDYMDNYFCAGYVGLGDK
ncbi:hypothetical protein KAW43_02770 [Candidatus Parcubacteria bacterium]|nr:hypothetical protein [Candidatus Parcubacteria bacterium]